jgi:hypothetical protein
MAGPFARSVPLGRAPLLPEVAEPLLCGGDNIGRAQSVRWVGTGVGEDLEVIYGQAFIGEAAGVKNVGLVMLVLLLVVVFAGLGFAAPVFWAVALVVFVMWVAGFFLRASDDCRWYRW